MSHRGGAISDLIGFAHRLRDDGLPIDSARVANALRALGGYVSLGSDDLYWAMRLTLCSRHQDVPVFDAAYRAWFGLASPVVTATALPPRVDGADALAVGTADREMAADAPPMAASASSVERLRIPPRLLLNRSDLAEMEAFVAALTRSTPLRRTMSQVPGGRRSLDVPRTAHTMLRHGGEPARLRYRRPAYVRRRLVLLLDVSDSMREHRDRLLRFAYAAVTTAPTATEVFTIGTRLARITANLRHPDPQAAIDALTSRLSDWNAGTRLGRTVTAFVRRWGEHRIVRSANVVLVSDGWEHDDLAALPVRIARLSRLAHRVIWANPGAHVGFMPAAPALVQSLPYVHLVSAHDAAALRSLAELLACSPCGPRCPRHYQPMIWSSAS
ncbi:VWA domain-containing protein [Micromonospora sp. NPDC049903]|uniref:VWA domain-containing protein n=1 Tax=Micromonospora sp. NPDC049903 TaxID=3364276 RepID=UPI00379FC9CD